VLPFQQIAPALERRRLQCYLALMLGDIVSMFAGFSLAGYLYLGPSGATGALIPANLLLPIFLTISLYNGAYSMGVLIRPLDGIVRFLIALAVSATTLVFFAFYAKASAQFSRVVFATGLLLIAFVGPWLRLQMRSFIAWRCGPRVLNELVIDDGGPKVDLPGTIRIAAADFALSPNLADPHALHRIGLAMRDIDRVMVSCPPARRAAWAMILKGANIEGAVLDDDVMELGAQGARIAGGHGWLQVSAGPLGMRARGMKRALDLLLAGSALLVLSPLLLFVAAAIVVEDGFPVLFVQRRLGRGNRFFDMYKFRSMRKAQADHDGERSTGREDERVTRVGRFIRRTSIDELPQLANVLLSDMSLVGPRPHAIGSQAGDKLFWEVDQRYWQRHSLKPGMSGLAQVRGLRGATEREADLANRLQADLEYLEGWTIWRDVRIILLTLRVLTHRQAY
jgi:lipopolysaccharide/colanic/teichoic acid biosynthesis glycosyltransferase